MSELQNLPDDSIDFPNRLAFLCFVARAVSKQQQDSSGDKGVLAGRTLPVSSFGEFRDVTPKKRLHDIRLAAVSPIVAIEDAPR
jgi:hypothetical protein